MSSYPYLMAVSVRTENKGTAVVTAEREEISGMSWNSQQSVLQTADSEKTYWFHHASMIWGGFQCSHLQDEEAQKVEVSRSLELFKEVERQECKQGVLWSLDEVVLEDKGHRYQLGHMFIQ